jgi:glycerol-3-phosphate acyltransferase PlsY
VPLWVLALVPVAYLVGTFPSAQLVARASGHDVLLEGSGNPGASNVMRLAGWKAGMLVLLADFAKGAVAAGAGLVLGGRPGAYALGIASIVGHMLPATRRFRGGKGVATGGGALIVLFPWIVLGLAVLWTAIARGFHKASVASLASAVAFPVLVAVSGYRASEVVVISLLAVLVIGRHANNLRRLVRGEEHTLGATDDADGPGSEA